MSEIPEDLRRAAVGALLAGGYTTRIGSVGHDAISQALLAERNRCLSIVNSIEPHTTLEFLMLETIARRVMGEE